MKIESIMSDFLDKTFLSFIAIIALTIIVYYTFVEYSVSHRREPIPPPPPKTNLEPIRPKTKEELEIEEEEKNTAYNPSVSKCSIFAPEQCLYEAFVRDDEPENLQEGFGIDNFFGILEGLFKLATNAIWMVTTIPEHMMAFGEGFLQLGIGVIHLFENIIQEVMTTLEDFGKFVVDIARCGFTWVQNLRICILWYILETIIYTLVAIFIWIPIYIVRILTFGKVDLNHIYLMIMGVSDRNKNYRMRDIDGKIVKKDGIMEKLDQMIHKVSGLHFMHFPDNVIKNCYACEIVEDVFNLAYDFTFGILNMFMGPMKDIFDAGKHFWHAFYLDMFFG